MISEGRRASVAVKAPGLATGSQMRLSWKPDLAIGSCVRLLSLATIGERATAAAAAEDDASGCHRNHSDWSVIWSAHRLT